jgi:hypothetical protein
MAGYLNIKVTPNALKGLSRRSGKIKRSVPVAKRAAEQRLKAVEPQRAKEAKRPAAERSRTAVEDPKLTRAQAIALRRIRRELGKVIIFGYELYHLELEREMVIRSVVLESAGLSVRQLALRYKAKKPDEITEQGARSLAVKLAKKGAVKVDKRLLRRSLACIDLIAVGEDVDLILGGDPDEDREGLVIIKDRLADLSKGFKAAGAVGSEDLDERIALILRRMRRMLSVKGRYDADRYRKLQNELETKVAGLSLPTSKGKRLRGVLSYLEQSEVLLSELLSDRIEADLKSYSEQCPWQLDLEIAEDYINAYSGMRIAWDMLYYMTNEAQTDVVILELGAEDSAAWDEGIIEHGKPPEKLWQALLKKARKHEDQEVHLYHYDNVLLTKLPVGEKKDLQYKANRGKLTDEQMRALIWAPWR